MIHPWVGLLGESNPSQNGKYVFMFYFNGTFRSVVIDDRLPLARLNRSIFVVDRSNPSLLWPALVEKAYLKVRGGYDFPGSNSGTDVWILTGWIPEQIFLQRYVEFHIGEILDIKRNVTGILSIRTSYGHVSSVLLKMVMF